MNQRIFIKYFIWLSLANVFCHKEQIVINAINNSKESHKDIVLKVKFSPDGKILASGGNDSDLILWDGKNGKYIRTLNGQYDKIFDIAFIDSKSEIITANYSGSILLWNIKQGLDKAIKLDGDFISTFDFIFSEKIFITASWDKTVKVLDIENKTVIKECKSGNHQIRTLKYSEKNKSLYAGTSKGYLLRWSLESCANEVNYEQKISEDTITSLDLNDELNLLVLGTADASLKIYDLTSLKETGGFNGHKSPINSIKIHPAYKKIISADKDGKIFFWDIGSGENMTFAAHDDAINSIDISPDGKRLASGSSDHNVKVWNIDKILNSK